MWKPPILLAVVVLLAGCHAGGEVVVHTKKDKDRDHRHPVNHPELVASEVVLTKAMAADLFYYDPFYWETDIYLVVYDNITGSELFRDQVYWGVNQVSYELQAYENLAFVLEAEGEFYGNLLITDAEVLYEGEVIDIVFDRLDDGRIVTLFNGEIVAVHYDPCVCLDA